MYGCFQFWINYRLDLAQIGENAAVPSTMDVMAETKGIDSSALCIKVSNISFNMLFPKCETKMMIFKELK